MSEIHSSSSAPESPAPALAAAKRPAAWMLLLVFFFGVAVYANSLLNGFAFDDVAIVRDSPHVLNLEWTQIWTDNYWAKTDGIRPDILYRPLTLWTYLANQAIAPGEAWTFHLVNIFLHALVSVGVCALAWRLIGDRTVAVVVGILFAVHPLHTEAVANTVGRAELLAALWTLLTLLVFLPTSPLIHETTPRRRFAGHGILVAVCFLAALFSKETPAALAFALVMIDLWRWSRWPRATRPGFFRWMFSQGFRYYLPVTLAVAVYLTMRIHACGLFSPVSTIHPVVNLLVSATVPERVVTPFLLLAKYLWLTFWPVHLSADYSAPSLLPTANPLEPLAAVGIMACVLSVILSVKAWRKSPQLLLVIGMFVTSYMLVANVIRIGTIFGERLFYWPSAFILMLVAWAVVGIFRAAALQRRRAAWGVATALLAVAVGGMSWRTWERNTDWADNIPLAISTARDNPASAKACSWAGSTLVVADRPDFVEVGRTLLERAAELAPDFVSVHWELAKYYGRRNDLARSLIHLTHAVRRDPGTAMTRRALDAVLEDLVAADPELVMPTLEAYKIENPKDEGIYLALALAYHAQKQYDLAEENAKRALELGSGVRRDGFDQFHEAAAELAKIRIDSGKVVEGIVLYRQYVMVERNSVSARLAIAKILLDVDPDKVPNALTEALMNLDKAEQIDPNQPKIRELRGAIALRRRERLDTLQATATAAPHQTDVIAAPGEAP